MLFFFFFPSKSFILRFGQSRRYLSGASLPMDTTWSGVIKRYRSRNVAPVQHYMLWALACSLPGLGSGLKDTYHRRAVCSLKVKLYQRYLHLMRWLHLSVIAIKTFMRSSNTFWALLNVLLLVWYPIHHSPMQIIKLAKYGEVCWRLK